MTNEKHLYADSVGWFGVLSGIVMLLFLLWNYKPHVGSQTTILQRLNALESTSVRVAITDTECELGVDLGGSLVYVPSGEVE